MALIGDLEKAEHQWLPDGPTLQHRSCPVRFDAVMRPEADGDPADQVYVCAACGTRVRLALPSNLPTRLR